MKCGGGKHFVADPPILVRAHHEADGHGYISTWGEYANVVMCQCCRDFMESLCENLTKWEAGEFSK